MEITPGEKAKLISRFGDAEFVSAVRKLVTRQEELCMDRLTATAKDKYDDEVMSMLLAKGGLMALASLKSEIRQLTMIAKENLVQPNQA